MTGKFEIGEFIQQRRLHRIGRRAALQYTNAQRVHGDSRAGWSMVYRILRRSARCERPGRNARGVPGQPSRSDCLDSRSQTGRISARHASGGETGTCCDRMKREALLRHLRRNGCVLRREGKEHSLWENAQTGHAERYLVTRRSRMCWQKESAAILAFQTHSDKWSSRPRDAVGTFGIALRALHLDTDELGPTFFRQDPGPERPGRLMPHVPCVTAREIRHPVLVIAEVKADNRTFHLT